MSQHPSWRLPVFNFLHPLNFRESFSAGRQTIVSDVFTTPFPFSSLFLSINYAPFSQGNILLEVQVYQERRWGDFFKLGYFSPTAKLSFPLQQTPDGQVQTDELVLTHEAEAYRFRIKTEGSVYPSLIAVCGVRDPFVYEEELSACLPEGSFVKEVAPISQMELNHPDRRRICSPVSLCMALNALGIPVSLREVMQGVFDHKADIYGNWLFNMAYAATLGTEAYVRRFGSLEELKEFITLDSLVIASVAYGKEELTGAPLETTPGHLVLIRGWGEGKVCVADPAAERKETVLRSYEAREFAKIWLHHKKGAAYIVRKK